MCIRSIKSLAKLLSIKCITENIKLHLGFYCLNSYSQEGEDLILYRIFENKDTGFYVDIGAHHPFRFSNTYIFYKRGWSGINVDANPESIILFNKFRKRDINVNFGVGEKKDTLSYYVFNEAALNTFDENLAKKRNGLKEYRIIDIIQIKVIPLRDILDEYLPVNTTIDFMNIDCEGMDFEVLKSNDWDKFRPNVLLAEVIPGYTFAELMRHPINEYLESKGYRLFAKCFNTCVYVENDFYKDAVLK